MLTPNVTQEKTPRVRLTTATRRLPLRPSPSPSYIITVSPMLTRRCAPGAQQPTRATL